MADLAQGETERVRRDIEQQVRARLNDAQRDLYRRLGEAVEWSDPLKVVQVC